MCSQLFAALSAQICRCNIKYSLASLLSFLVHTICSSSIGNKDT